MSTTHSSGPVRGVIYFRMSSSKQEESIDQQRDWAFDACKRENVEVVATFTDAGIAGHETDRRDDFHALIEFVKKARAERRPIDAVVCWSASRFSRSDSQETAYYLWQLREAGCRLMLTREGWIDFADDNQRILFNLKQDTSEHAYVKRLSADVLRGQKWNAEQGFWNGGAAPFGYRIVHVMVDTGDGKRRRKARLVEDEGAAETVRWIFEEYCKEHASLFGLCRKLNARGVKPVRALKWTPTAIAKVLRNPTYLGNLPWNRTTEGKFNRVVGFQIQAKCGVKTSGDNAPTDIITAADRHPFLVSRETFDRAQRLLYERRTVRKSGDCRRDYVLTGLLVCGNCDTPMTARRESHRLLKCYICTTYNRHGVGFCGFNKLEEAPLLRAVVTKLQEHLLNPETLDRLEAALARLAGGKGKEEAARSAGLRRAAEDAAAQADAAAERFLVESDPQVVAACRRKLTELLARKEAAEKALAEALAAATPKVDAERIVAKARGYMTDLAGAVERGDLPKLRVLLRELIERVEVTFTHEKRKGRTFCTFARGLIYPTGAAVPTDYQSFTAADRREQLVIEFLPADLVQP